MIVYRLKFLHSTSVWLLARTGCHCATVSRDPEEVASDRILQNKAFHQYQWGFPAALGERRFLNAVEGDNCERDSCGWCHIFYSSHFQATLYLSWCLLKAFPVTLVYHWHVLTMPLLDRILLIPLVRQLLKPNLLLTVSDSNHCRYKTHKFSFYSLWSFLKVHLLWKDRKQGNIYILLRSSRLIFRSSICHYGVFFFPKAVVHIQVLSLLHTLIFHCLFSTSFFFF